MLIDSHMPRATVTEMQSMHVILVLLTARYACACYAHRTFFQGHDAVQNTELFQTMMRQPGPLNGRVETAPWNSASRSSVGCGIFGKRGLRIKREGPIVTEHCLEPSGITSSLRKARMEPPNVNPKSALDSFMVCFNLVLITVNHWFSCYYWYL